ncbi:MAG: hypothetical protein JNL79_02165 [Myxococcales bacterium]|nr:hypothetical protein [Myxococcales bacterium]
MTPELALALEQDLALVGADSPCSKAGQLDQGWSCFRARGDQYHGTPTGSRLPSQVALGTTRLVATTDFWLGGFALGARLGWAFRGVGPVSDGAEHVIPVDAALRARVALSRSSTLRIELLGVFGLRQLDARATVKVNEDRSVPPSVYQLDNPDKQSLDAYKRLGLGYVAVGLGVTFRLGEATALRFELPLSVSFPTSGVAVSPSAAFVVKL